MLIIYGLCNGNACTAAGQHERCFPNWRILSKDIFSHIHQTMSETGSLPGVPLQSEREVVDADFNSQPSWVYEFSLSRIVWAHMRSWSHTVGEHACSVFMLLFTWPIYARRLEASPLDTGGIWHGCVMSHVATKLTLLQHWVKSYHETLKLSFLNSKFWISVLASQWREGTR